MKIDKEEYIKVCKTSDLHNKRGKKFTLTDEVEIALFKINDKFYAVDNVCPHNHVPQIYEGYIDDMYVICPVHGFQFHLETGKQPQEFGCKLQTFELKIEDDYVYVKKPEKRKFNFNFWE